MTDVLATDAHALRTALAKDDDLVDVRLSLPRATAELVLRLIEAQRRGGAVVVPNVEEVTPSQAAVILGISRPQVYRLIDEGRLAHRMVGTHRRIFMESLTAFRAEQQKRQRHAMKELTRLSNEAGWVE